MSAVVLAIGRSVCLYTLAPSPAYDGQRRQAGVGERATMQAIACTGFPGVLTTASCPIIRLTLAQPIEQKYLI